MDKCVRVRVRGAGVAMLLTCYYSTAAGAVVPVATSLILSLCSWLVLTVSCVRMHAYVRVSACVRVAALLVGCIATVFASSLGLLRGRVYALALQTCPQYLAKKTVITGSSSGTLVVSGTDSETCLTVRPGSLNGHLRTIFFRNGDAHTARITRGGERHGPSHTSWRALCGVIRQRWLPAPRTG